MAVLTSKQMATAVLDMAGSTSPVEKAAKGYTYHKERFGYVLGGQGELYTRDLAENWARTRHNGTDGEYFLEDAKHWYTPPRKVADCSGMIIEAARRYQRGFGDRTANGLHSDFVGGGAISTLPHNEAGLGVWKDGHIGVTTGDGRIVESKGVLHGVVIAKIGTTAFTHWGHFPFVDYSDAVPAIPSPPKPQAPALTRILKYVWFNRMRGEDVRTLQVALIAHKYNLGKSGADGVFGTLTRDAVITFQKNVGITVDGKVGQQTWGTLFD